MRYSGGMKTQRIEGHAAIRHAATHGLSLGKHTDPVEEAREGLTIEEAQSVAKEDPSLVYVDTPYETAETITDRQISDLRDEAGAAGDSAAVKICESALDGDDDAISDVVGMINAARAMVD